MNISKRDYFPFGRDLSQFFDTFLKNQSQDSSFIDTGTWAPAVDIKEESDGFLVIADLPGMKKEDINIALDKNILTIQGERKLERKEEQEGYSRMERVQGQFYRRFSLPQTADEEHISAKYKQGVLEISIPKKPESTQKRIDIKVEE